MLGLDSLAITAQSLVGYFYGSNAVKLARTVARYTVRWSFWVAAVLGLGLWLGRSFVIRWLVPPTAVDVFLPAWLLASAGLPVSALAFATDGVHWGTGDFGFLRNVMITATVVGVVGLLLVDSGAGEALAWVWAVTMVWTAVRAALGMLRVWPGIWKSPLRL